jgi:DNA-directed RNA polymerase specialized sigma24 family protein
MNVALRILRDAGEAEDLMQSVFLKSSALRHNLTPPKAQLRYGFFNARITVVSIGDST